jgi:hypothetical protein
LRFRFFQALENLAARPKESFALVRETHRACGTMKQLHAEPSLQIANALTDERLADVEDVRGRGETARFHDGFEYSHLQKSFILHEGWSMAVWVFVVDVERGTGVGDSGRTYS